MTKKLYWETPYETTFSGEIIKIVEKGIILDQTLFYPGGGGQESDHGIIIVGDDEYPILKVTSKGDEIYHYISSKSPLNLKIGDSVRGKIDWNYRYGLMKAHSSQHIFSAVLKKLYGLETTHVSIGSDDVTLHTGKTLNYDQLQSALESVHLLCTIDKKQIVGNVLPYQKAKDLYGNTLRGAIPEHSTVRIVETIGLDIICCGGTHLQSSIEIGPIVLYKFNKGKEIKYYTGKKAAKFLSQCNITILKSANLLDQKIENITTQIEKRSKQLEEITDGHKLMTESLLNIALNNSKIEINGTVFQLLKGHLDQKILNSEFRTISEKKVFLVQINSRKLLVLSSDPVINAKSLFLWFAKKYGGKGGGNQRSAQGILESEPEDHYADLRQYFRS